MGYESVRSTADIGAFLRVRASLGAEDIVTWFGGTVYGIEQAQGLRPLLRVEGVNIARAVLVEGRSQILAREAVFYQDYESGEILESFLNPYTGARNRVLHRWVDPLVTSFSVDAPVGNDIDSGPPKSAPAIRRAKQSVPVPVSVSQEVHGDQVQFAIAQLTGTEGTDGVEGTQSTESTESTVGSASTETDLVRYFASKHDLNGHAKTVPSGFSRVRSTRWLPWMEMGNHPGSITEHLGGQKLIGGWTALPERLRTYVEQHRPEFAFAPSPVAVANESRWSHYSNERGRRAPWSRSQTR